MDRLRLPALPSEVVVHPLVLLSVVDHYNRVAKDTKKRVVGVLLGEVWKGRVDATNCYAVPFEEDDKDPTIWFLDHSYLENMFRMFKKVNARERIIGWYHTGPRLREADLDIHQLLANYCENPVLVICEVQPKDMGLPVHAYTARDEVREDGTQKSQRVFVNLPTEVGATEAEDIGVEHLLRDVKDATISTLSTEVGEMVTGLRGLKSRLEEVRAYLRAVLDGRLPINHDILRNLQPGMHRHHQLLRVAHCLASCRPQQVTIAPPTPPSAVEVDTFNLLPNLNVAELSKSFAVESNDMMLVMYVAALIRSVLALHNLIDNKEGRAYHEREKSKKQNGKKAAPAAGEKDKEAAAAAADGQQQGTGDAKKTDGGGSKE
ncbi:hypothetical protein N2152v2_009125 [Parachlorella kessleri]